MIITWNTDPSKGQFKPGSGKFSSYYQYDTVTRKFVRVRLELGRNPSSSGGDSGGTGAFFSEKRYVGFSNERLDTTSNKWSIVDGELYFDGTKLATEPASGLRTYDTSRTDFSTGSRALHTGNLVTDTPHYPDGIRASHLSLIANDAILNQESLRGITTSKASPATLSDALKAKVSAIVDKPFIEITDADLLTCLKTQVAQIKAELVTPSKESLDSSLDTVDKLITDIKIEITDKGLVPNEKFEAAFKDLAAKAEAAKTAAEDGKGIVDAIKEVSTAKAALNEAVTEIDAIHQESLREQMEASQEAIETAQTDSETWEGIDAEYESPEEATTLDEYEESIGNEEVIKSV